MRPSLFSGLRLSLTLLYLVAGITLVVLVGGSAYGLLRYYFESTTDLALHHELARQLRLVSAPVPPDVAAADADWTRAHDAGRFGGPRPGDPSAETSDGELAAIYTLPLDSSGAVIARPGAPTPPFAPDPTATVAARAAAAGTDTRTTVVGGVPVRLLTESVNQSGGLAFLQVGRPIADQEAILRDVLTGLLVLGGACTVILAAVSWWLAGRSLRPAREAWDRQQTFVANAGHELRAPLTLIRATADVALRELPTTDKSDQRELWSDILRDCDHMARLVEDLLLLSRLDAGRLTLTPRRIPLADLLADLERQLRRVAAERGVHVVVEGANGDAVADPERLRQVLLILLDNALRHTPDGGEVRLASQQHDGKAHVVVADTGEGIPPEHLARVFERFYVVDSSRAASGSGLGLSIARALVEAQHGEIHLTSHVGKGTRVEVILPGAPR